LNVVVRCDRACQTDMESGVGPDTKMQIGGTLLNTNLAPTPTLSRFCSIESHSDQPFPNLGSDSLCDVAKICPRDVKMSSAMNMLSPFEEDSCWNSTNLNPGDVMNFTNAI